MAKAAVGGKGIHNFEESQPALRHPPERWRGARSRILAYKLSGTPLAPAKIPDDKACGNLYEAEAKGLR